MTIARGARRLPAALVPWLGTLARLLLAAIFALAAFSKITQHPSYLLDILRDVGLLAVAVFLILYPRTQMIAAGKVTLIYHPIAILNNSTSPSGYSTRAGSAAGCAADGGKFLEYTKALYAQQPAEGSAGLTDDKLIQIGNLIQIGKQIQSGNGVGLTGDSFAQCVHASLYSGWMSRNTDAAAQRNIQGTPTVLVAGEQIDATVDALTAAVNAAVQ